MLSLIWLQMLAILTTHPIQYQVPLWREMAARGVPLEVWYLSDQGFRKSLDTGFAASFAWDIDMMGGYPSRFVPTRPKKINIAKFWGARIHDTRKLFLAKGVTALLINGWVPVGYWQAVFQAHSLGIPVLLRGETNDLRHPSWKDPFKRPAMKMLFGRIAKFLAIGLANRRFYESYGVPPERIGYSPYCVDNRYFRNAAESLQPQRNDLRVSFGIPADAMCFLFCGKMIPKKRLGDLLDAFELLIANPERFGIKRPLHLLVVGDGELRRVYESRVKSFAHGEARPAGPRLGLDRMITFAGFLNQSEISKTYCVADCLVLPSDAGETWGLVVNEAMACGLPAIVSDKVGCGEDLVVKDVTGATYPLGDVQRLADALAGWSDPARCSSAKESVLRKISDYSIERAVTGILESLPSGLIAEKVSVSTNV